MGEKVNKIRKYLLQNLAWISIVISCILFILSQWDYISEPIRNLLEKIGITVLSSGVFSAVLKSLQFTGLFREEISRIMIGTEFIKNRTDLPELWKEISKILYNKKFPGISEYLENRILNSYFPKNETFYYEDYNVCIKISEINENFEITYEQESEYYVVLDNELDEAELMIESEISDNSDNSLTIVNKLRYFRVDGEDWSLEEDESTKSNPKKTLYRIVLNKGKKRYKIHSCYDRKYSLKDENYKLFRMKHITKGMMVLVDYPEDVSVSFFNIGLIKGFDSYGQSIKNRMCKVHKDDIILPQQGFGMSFEKK